MEHKDEAHKEIAENIAHGIARGIAVGIAIAIAFVLFILLGGLVVQWLWNWLLPEIFGVRQITFWQALGLLALCRVLFGSFGRAGGHHRDTGSRHREWWRKRSREDGLAAPQNTVSESGPS